MKKRKQLFIGVYNPSIILTYISVFCSVYGIGMLTTVKEQDSLNIIGISMILLVIAGVCDMFDGKIARMCKRTEKEKLFGIQLDSLADTVSFGIFPATVLLYITDKSVSGTVIAMFYVFAGIMRLGWFNITTEENKESFQGLPITFSALIFPILYICLKNFDTNIISILFQIAFIITAFLFILNFKLKKINKTFSILLVILSIIAIALLLVL